MSLFSVCCIFYFSYYLSKQIQCFLVLYFAQRVNTREGTHCRLGGLRWNPLASSTGCKEYVQVYVFLVFVCVSNLPKIQITTPNTQAV
mmetsp:Transcript_77361/g.208792  ORF Transcript_77361/g.208792 Transcript_77361/m.208792 type:complete len:88 (-) Transcript_77361:126-389(-)